MTDPRKSVDGFRPPYTDMVDMLRHRAAEGGDFLTELRPKRRSWTATEWSEQVAATAAVLSSWGVRRSDRVAGLAGGTAEALALAYACWALGACYVPLNPADPAARQAHVLRDAAAGVLVCGPANQQRADELAGLADVTVRSASALLAPGQPSAELPSVGTLDVEALRVYTSGTTGEPKGVVLTAAALLTDCDALAQRLGWDATTRVLTVLPVHHVNGLVVSSLLPWTTGSSMVLRDRFSSEAFWSDAADEGVTTASLVPTLLEYLLVSPGTPPPGCREVLCGAGPLLVETALAFEERFALPVRHLYGLSETTAVCCLVPALTASERIGWHRDPGFPSVGPALAHTEVTVLDAHGAPLPAGARGELAVRGAVLMTEYAGLPEATAEALRDGWFHTGDEGFWLPGPDGAPWFSVTGRLKELIVRGGSNFSPLEVDEVLHAHPAVRHGLAVPFDNRWYGEEVAAYVVLCAPVTADELLAHCARHLDHARRPKVVVFGKEVPFTATGKPKRLELRRLLADELAVHRDTQFRDNKRPAAPAPGPHPAATSPPPPPHRPQSTPHNLEEIPR